MELAKQLILNLKQDNLHVGYGFQKESEALVTHILHNLLKSPLPELQPELKNEEDSQHFREEGNKHFVTGDNLKAIEFYNKSLAYANTKELMAHTYANRSAALYRKKLYKQCLTDIDAALSLGYAEEKKSKLKERAVRALQNMNLSHNNNLSKNLKAQNFNSSANNLNESDNLKFLLIKEISIDSKGNPLKDQIMRRVTSQSSPGTSQSIQYLKDKGKISLTYDPREEAPSGSGIKICFSKIYGRYLVATRAFEPGDIIAIEDPYSYIIYQDKYYTHCHYCLQRSYNMIPCDKCPIALYCSEECKSSGWKLAHCTECPILSIISNLLSVDRDKIRMLTKIVRLLIIATANGSAIRELREDIKIAESNPDNRTAGFTNKGIFDSKSARSALSLATNMSKRLPTGLSAFACISALAAILLATQTKFFGEIQKTTSDLKNTNKFQDIKFCASIMFRACVITSSNCFSIQQTPGIKVGSGLYVLHSLLNHSCAPNTLRHFNGLRMITRALEPISPGEQIFTSYGAGYQHVSRFERRKKMMEDYYFECNCPACISDWPTYQEILYNHVGSIAGNKELVEKLKPFKKRLLQNKYDIEAAKSIIKILYRETKMPCEEIVNGLQYLKSYYLDP